MRAVKQMGPWNSLGISVRRGWRPGKSQVCAGQGELPSKTIGISTKLFSNSGPNLVILAGMDNELRCGQAQNGVNSDFLVKFDLDGQDQLAKKQ